MAKITKQTMLDSRIQVHGAGEMVSATYAISVIEQLEDKLKESELQHGLTKIALEHKTVLLESCEKALRERDGL